MKSVTFRQTIKKEEKKMCEMFCLALIFVNPSGQDGRQERGGGKASGCGVGGGEGREGKEERK